MLYQNVHVFAQALRVIDATVLGVGTITIWHIGSRLNLWPGDHPERTFLFAGCFAATFIIAATLNRTYHARRTESVLREAAALGGISLCAAGIASLAAQLIVPGLSATFCIVSAMVAVVALMALRLAIRITLRGLRRRGKDLRHWMVVGKNLRSAALAEEVLAHPKYGIRIAQLVDFVDDPARINAPAAERWSRSPLSDIPQAEIKKPEEIRPMLTSQVIDEVVICLPVRSFYDDIEGVLHECSEAGISVKFPPKVFDRASDKIEASHVGRVLLVTHFTGPAQGLSLAAKRVLDVLGAAIGLVVLSPLLLLIAIAIRIDSPGSILFKQTRVGLHGRQFRMLKFRTMIADAPKLHDQLARQNQVEWPAFKIKNDPRLTRVGAVLRKYHLDEFPQLWNVLVGEMSLVGPRPMPLYAATGNEWWQRRRFSVQPGLTCLWQVGDDRDKISFHEWMQRDLEYIDNWSLWLDLRLIFATLGTVVRGTGW